MSHVHELFFNVGNISIFLSTMLLDTEYCISVTEYLGDITRIPLLAVLEELVKRKRG